MTRCRYGSLDLFFLFGAGHQWVGWKGWVSWVVVERLGVAGAQARRRWGTQSKEQGRPTAAAYSCLLVQIYGSLAQCKDYQRELYGCALALRRFIDLQCSPRHRMSTALGKVYSGSVGALYGETGVCAAGILSQK